MPEQVSLLEFDVTDVGRSKQQGNVKVKLVKMSGSEVSLTYQGGESIRAFARDETGKFLAHSSSMRSGRSMSGSFRGEVSSLQVAVVSKLRQAGAEVAADRGGIRVRAARGTKFKPVDITTQPYPGFPTDMQAQFMVLAARAHGQSIITETIFENRFMHIPELFRMNAEVQVQGPTAIVKGPCRFEGTTVMASDLRASAALILAGLVARNTTRVRRVYHLDRGYERIELKLRKLGANIRRVKE